VAKFTLTIETSDAFELANITSAIAGEMDSEAAPASLLEDAARVMNVPKTRQRRAKKDGADAAELTGGEASLAETDVSSKALLSTTASPFDNEIKLAEKDVAKLQDPKKAGVTLADCKKSLSDLIEKIDTDKALKVLQGFGIERVSACPEDKFGELKAHLDAALNAAG
jgi:hypothetical protein